MDPEVVQRLTAQPGSAGHSTAAIGVPDLAHERARLEADSPGLPAVRE